MISLTAEKTNEGQELFDLLKEIYPDFSAKALKSAFKSGDITLNGQDAYGDDTVHANDVIEIYTPNDTIGIPLTPEIIYQDENFVIVDKPASLPSRPDDSDGPNALDMVEEFMKQQGEYCLDALMVPYLVYPLGQYVSGLLLLAKHESAYLFLEEAIAQRRIARYYVCPVRGHAEESDELMAYHTKDKLNTRAFILDKHRKDAKPIVTRYSALSVGDSMSLLMVRPITNYLHQVRAHLAFDGLPVIGDPLYGDKRFNKKCGAHHIALCLKTIVFEVGKGHAYAYINNKRFDSKTQSFPKCVYDQGLMENID